MTLLPFSALDIGGNVDSSGCSLVLPKDRVNAMLLVTPSLSAQEAKECLQAHIMALDCTIETMS